MRPVWKLVSETQLAKIDARQIHLCIAVVGDFDEFEVVAVDAPPVLRMVMDFGNDQRRQVDIGTALGGADMAVQPIDALLKPVLHVVHILCMLRHLVPALVVAADGLGYDSVNLIDTVADAVVIQGHAFLRQLKPSFGKIATKLIRVEQVFPKTRSCVVLVVELPNVVPTSIAKGIITEGKVIVPDGTGAELAATVLMEEGAEVIHVDIGSELGHDHEIDERRDVDDRWDTCCDVGIIAVSYRLKVEEHAMDIVVLCVGDVFVFGVMVDKLRIYRTPPTEKISLHAPSQGVVIGTVGLHDVATGHFGRLVTGLVHLLNVDTVFVHLDFLHEDIEATIIAVENHLAILASRGILADLVRQLVGQHVAHPGLVVRQRVENPVVFGRHPKEADIVVGDIVVLECRQAVRLLVRNHLRGVATPLNANMPVIVEVFGVVDVSQIVA